MDCDMESCRFPLYTVISISQSFQAKICVKQDLFIMSFDNVQPV